MYVGVYIVDGDATLCSCDTGYACSLEFVFCQVFSQRELEINAGEAEFWSWNQDEDFDMHNPQPLQEELVFDERGMAHYMQVLVLAITSWPFDPGGH